MKKYSILIIVMSIAFGSVNAQIKVKSDGRVYLKGFKSSDDYNNEVSVQVYGKYGSYLAGGKLAFGDYGSMANYGGNVVIGEYGDWDSDILQLHGKNGIYITRGDGNQFIGMYDAYAGNRFIFSCDVYSYGTKLTSDERLKTNIDGLDSCLVQLKKLNGVSYNYNFPDDFGKIKKPAYSSNESNVADIDNMTDKEKKDKEFFEKFEIESRRPDKKKMGFLAQDLQKVFPELVEQDSSGYYHVDYIGLIPVIIEALKEQQNIIDAQSLKLKELENTIEGSNIKNNPKNASILTDNNILNATTNAFLFQNTPNPFSFDTEIKYYIPEVSSNAMLYVFNLQGNLIMTEKISGTGNGSITINGSELNPGMYVYSLLINGQEVDTKRMILTE